MTKRDRQFVGRKSDSVKAGGEGGVGGGRGGPPKNPYVLILFDRRGGGKEGTKFPRP